MEERVTFSKLARFGPRFSYNLFFILDSTDVKILIDYILRFWSSIKRD